MHGLWPEVPPYGNSQCVAPGDSTPPSVVYPCYAPSKAKNYGAGAGLGPLAFEQHEWSAHGQCSGTQSADDFFGQICKLSGAPIATLESVGFSSLDSAVAVLTQAGYAIFATDTNNAQIELSACLNQTSGLWTLAAVSDFPTVCGGSAKKQ